MKKFPEKCCFNCVLSKWEYDLYTPTGRIREHSIGRCLWKFPEIDLPDSVLNGGIGFYPPTPGGIGLFDGTNCKCFVEKNK